jgi:mRNA-degrading endonuclease RelE of RelBE toxin-antitoxin system
MSFKVFLSSTAAKFLENLDKKHKQRIIEKLKQLENNPKGASKHYK